MTLYLSRLQVARTPSVQALGGLLDPAGGEKLDAHHKLVWSAFAGDPTAARDFLWRAEGGGRFITLSRRPPAASPIFEPPEIRDFAPDLAPGDRLGFALRANATRTEKTRELSAGGKVRKRHIDLVMDGLPPKGGGRTNARLDTARTVAASWLAGQGSRGGFAPSTVVLEDYSVRRFRGRGAVTFGILDMTGTLTVSDPETFLAALVRGFGRAKAFGCGLMLIRRA